MTPVFHRRVLAALVGAACASGAQASAPLLDARQVWAEYLEASLTPAYTWAGALDVQAPTGFRAYAQDFGRTDATALSTDVALRPGLSLAFDTADRAQVRTSTGLGLMSPARSGMESSYFSSSLVRAVGQGGSFSLSGIIAHQRFSTLGLGSAEWELNSQGYNALYGGPTEVSSGSGVRMEYRQLVSPTVGWSVAMQSKLSMDAFKAYRGVYSEPGDFDAPARVRVGLDLATSRNAGFTLGVERLYYSDVNAFTSAALPVRFLALLGDGSAPAFSWRDLTVYTLDWTVRSDRLGEFWLGYTSRQQPSPTSELLHRALEQDFTNRNFVAGVRRDFGAAGQLSFAASYAPSTYFLGATPYAQRDLDGKRSQIEAELLWVVPF